MRAELTALQKILYLAQFGARGMIITTKPKPGENE